MRNTPFQASRKAIYLVAGVLFGLSACKDNPSTPANATDPVAKIEINTPKTALWLTDTLTVTANLYTASGALLQGRKITWESSDPQILSIDEAGLVEALKTGQATIEAQSEGKSKTVTFDIYTYELIYEVAVNGQPTLFSLSLDNQSTPQQLTEIEPFAFGPAPSPDGSQIAYVSMDETLNSEVYLLDLSTNTSKQITFNDYTDDMVTWSPDGNKLALRSNLEGRIEDIVIYNFADQSMTNLTRDPPGITVEDREPTWSPDGSKIAYSSYAGGNMDLWVMDADGANKTQLTVTPDYDTEAAWSPDGTKILFRRWSNSGMSLMLYHLTTEEESEIPLAGYQRMPTWSPDGRWIAFVSQPTLQDRPEIYMMRPDGSDRHLLTRELSWGGGQHPSFRKTQ